ncbi:MAG: transcriptional regulator [Bacteroidetes bacterium MedPE-SWsnd-G2]|nr:MAG: transcriptional regulator [Bacteroidetes bacterium MedPE-SWsnd-G2]
MINNTEFSKRLQKVITYYDETSSSFAEKIGVQRSNISHLLSGRNKPSLEFILKVLNTYPEVELYWLLNGKGSFPKQEIETKKPTQITTNPLPPTPSKPDQNLTVRPTEHMGKIIDRIVIFYNDGTFENFVKD